MFDSSIRVLIVDDMNTMRKIVAKTCRELGLTNLCEAADGALAWEVINNAKPSIGLIISDWNMPNCTGVDLLKRIRADKRFSNLPFVLVTAEAEKHQIAEAVKAGVSGYVVKPFTTELMRKQLEGVYTRLTGNSSGAA